MTRRTASRLAAAPALWCWPRPNQRGTSGKRWAGCRVFGAFWDRDAELPTGGGSEAELVGGAVTSSAIAERDLSVQISGWMLMEAAYDVAARLVL